MSKLTGVVTFIILPPSVGHGEGRGRFFRSNSCIIHSHLSAEQSGAEPYHANNNSVMMKMRVSYFWWRLKGAWKNHEECVRARLRIIIIIIIGMICSSWRCCLFLPWRRERKRRGELECGSGRSCLKEQFIDVLNMGTIIGTNLAQVRISRPNMIPGISCIPTGEISGLSTQQSLSPTTSSLSLPLYTSLKEWTSTGEERSPVPHTVSYTISCCCCYKDLIVANGGAHFTWNNSL